VWAGSTPFRVVCATPWSNMWLASPMFGQAGRPSDHLFTTNWSDLKV
jgi:hypothetical protein